MPGLPGGKPAGLPCPHLDEHRACTLFGRPERPAVCSGLPPQPQMCRSSATQALAWLTWLEQATEPTATGP